MRPQLRKLALTTHVTFSVGWLGAVAAYLALAITSLSAPEEAASPAMERIAWLVIVPCSILALISGLVQSLGTEWGLFRHYWIVAKLFLTTIGTIILLAHMPAVSRMSSLAAEEAPAIEIGALPIQLVVHAAGGLLLLLATTTLSIFKPWGRTAYGRQRG